MDSQVFTFTYGWVLINVLCYYFGGLKYLVKLLLFSCVLQTASLSIIEGRYVGTPIMITCIFITAKYLANTSYVVIITKHSNPKLNKYITFFIYSFFLTSVSAGLIFKGLPIFQFDVVSAGSYRPLSITLNYFYIIFLYFFYISAAIVIVKTPNILSEQELKQTIEFISIFILIVGFLVYLGKLFNPPLIEFLGPILYPQEEFSNFHSEIIRFYATFLEPSYASVFLGALFWFRIAQSNKYNIITTIGLLAGLLLSFGMTGYGAFMIAGFIFMLINRNFKAATTTIIIGILSLLILLQSDWLNLVSFHINSKKQLSYDRFVWNDLAIDLFFKTFGIGIGMHMGRASSLFLNLLLKTGIIGTLLYLRAFYHECKILFSLRKENTIFLGTFMYILTVFIGQCIGDPDIDFCAFWFGIFLFCIVWHYAILNKNKDVHQTIFPKC